MEDTEIRLISESYRQRVDGFKVMTSKHYLDMGFSVREPIAEM